MACNSPYDRKFIQSFTLTHQDSDARIFNFTVLAPLNSLHLCFNVLETYFELDNSKLSSKSLCLSQR
ncbi:CIC_collapsed_G0054270.mRNA.1.CDS.1 [Saccharomyces cerevisiae]|nr:CIC_collapsed_G0054270.mRNA.1.CDS.1 [Saccharomyces cerevisiae]